MNKIELRQPIMINGKEVKELTYDTAQITVRQFCEAETYSFTAGGNKPKITTHEFDHGLHIYLGMYAVIAVNPEIDITDLERIKGFDLIKLANIGRNFTLTGAGGSLEQSTSGDTSEIMPEPLTLVQAKSENID